MKGRGRNTQSHDSRFWWLHHGSDVLKVSCHTGLCRLSREPHFLGPPGSSALLTLTTLRKGSKRLQTLSEPTLPPSSLRLRTLGIPVSRSIYLCPVHTYPHIQCCDRSVRFFAVECAVFNSGITHTDGHGRARRYTLSLVRPLLSRP